MSVDPISKDIVDFSPYHFSFDSPIFLEDVNGMYGDPATQKPAAKPAMRVVRSAKVVKMTEQVKPGDAPWWMKLTRLSGRVAGTIGLLLTPVPSTPLPSEMKGDETYYIKHPRNHFHEDDEPGEPSMTWEQFRASLPRRPENDDKSRTITLYRGVSRDAQHPLQYKLAKRGIAAPMPLIVEWETNVGGMILDGHNDAELHTGNDIMSIWTSWTTDPSVAAHFATWGGKTSGVILKKEFKKSIVVYSAYDLSESEVLVPGIVTGAKVEHVGSTGVRVQKK